MPDLALARSLAVVSVYLFATSQSDSQLAVVPLVCLAILRHLCDGFEVPLSTM